MKNKTTIFTTPNCPRCEQLKKLLADSNIDYTTIDISTAEGLTEARTRGIFAKEVPVLESGNIIVMTSAMFHSTGQLKGHEIIEMIQKERRR
jgi:glutaredoxin